MDKAVRQVLEAVAAERGTPCYVYFFDAIAERAAEIGQVFGGRFRLSYADVAGLLAERGVRVDPSSSYAWVREFAPLYEDAARSCRRAVGECWSVDETYVKVAGEWAYVYRARRARPGCRRLRAWCAGD